jgi:hypothetical protein
LIIVTDEPGQLGNQLWAFTNMICIARHYRNRIVIVLRKDYYELLDRVVLRKARVSGVYIYSSSETEARLIKLFCRKVLHILKKPAHLFKKLPLFVFNNKIENFNFLKTKSARICFINSWNQREYKQCFIDNSKYVRALIQPRKAIVDKVEATFEDIVSRFENPVIVAVHIRRGDYKQFFGGKYYFDDVVYRYYMNDLQKELETACVVFYLFSNEDINVSNFADLNIFYKKGESNISDMWAMSKCNYIIGPPSTFSMWASFWNSVPLCFLHNSSDSVRLSSFRPIIAQDVFASNSVNT